MPTFAVGTAISESLVAEVAAPAKEWAEILAKGCFPT
jgi:hypothetical protein